MTPSLTSQRPYGFEIVGLVIPSLATHVEPSAEHIAGLVEVIREHNVPAVFGETTVSDKLAQAVARETGASVVQLYSGLPRGGRQRRRHVPRHGANQRGTHC